MSEVSLESVGPRRIEKLTPALPLEIIESILSHISPSDTSQPTLHACTLVSRGWYSAAIGLLYETPRIRGKNYDSFAKSICPSINAHIRKNGLAALVRSLDLSRLVHHGSKSLTARLLGRVKGNIEEFIAPQASFGLVQLYATASKSKLSDMALGLMH